MVKEPSVTKGWATGSGRVRQASSDKSGALADWQLAAFAFVAGKGKNWGACGPTAFGVRYGRAERREVGGKRTLVFGSNPHDRLRRRVPQRCIPKHERNDRHRSISRKPDKVGEMHAAVADHVPREHRRDGQHYQHIR